MNRRTHLPPSELAGRRILVTGAAGQIGSLTTAHLASRGALVTALSLDGAPVEGADRVLAGDACVLPDVDLALDGVEFVVHLAARATPESGTPYEVYSTNVVATFTVLERAAERGVRRMVTASSINRYGLPMGTDRAALPAYWPLDTDTPARLSDWYSLSKFNDENTAQMVANRWGATVVALRFPFTQRPDVIREASDHFTLHPREQLTEGWSYLDTRDAARAIELGLTAELHGAHAFYLAASDTTVPYRTQDLIDRFAASVPRKREFVGREVPIDLGDAERLIGFRAEHLLNLSERDLPVSEQG